MNVTFDLSAEVASIFVSEIRKQIEVEYHIEQALDETTLIKLYSPCHSTKFVFYDILGKNY